MKRQKEMPSALEGTRREPTKLLSSEGALLPLFFPLHPLTEAVNEDF